MDIWKLEVDEALGWAWSAAESIADTRMASGALSRGAAADLMRAVVSTFRAGVPKDMDVWCDSVGGWLWIDRTDNLHTEVRAGALTSDSDVSAWADFIRCEFAGQTLSWCVWGDGDSLRGLVEAVGARPCSVVMGASVSSIITPSASSGAWLRPMGAGELMRFQVAAANELGVALVTSNAHTDVDEARREAFRSIEAELRDGVASPGHRLYSLCHGGQTVGGAWLEIDSGVATVRSVVVDSKARGEGHRRAALAALAAAAHMEGARSIHTTVIPADHPFMTVLRDMGMDIVSTDYIQTPRTHNAPVLQKV